MPELGLEFYDRNATRAWPLDDAATGLDDAGVLLPRDVLVDAGLRFPRSLGLYLHVAGVAVTPSAVSIVLGATAYHASEPQPVGQFIPAAALTVAQPAPVGVPLAVTPLAAGVAGWLVLGPGVDEPFSGRFADGSQGQLLPRCASSFRAPLDVSELRVMAGPPLAGLVPLTAGGDAALAMTTIEVDHVPVRAIMLSLVDDPRAAADVYAAYAGPCGARPEDGTCPDPGIEAINGVTPGCDGVIELEFRGMHVAPDACGVGAVVVELPIGLGDVCGERTWSLAAASSDAGSCGISSEGSESEAQWSLSH